MREPFPHQAQSVVLLRAALKAGKKRPILQLQTGAGKTKVAADIFHMARAKGKRCLFIADAISLIDQTVEAFWEDGHREIGVIQAQHPLTDYSKPVQVASIQTLARRALPQFDLAIIDEVHGLHKTHIEILGLYPDVPFIGLSATPWTRGLGNYFDCLIKPITAAELVDIGRTLPLVAYAPHSPDLSHVKIKAGEYDEGALSIVMQDNKLVADVVETWKELGEGRPTLGYAVDCAHAQHMMERFNNAGIPAGYIDAKTDVGERKSLQARLEAGILKVVWSVGTLVKGTDWRISCGIDCQPTKSHKRHVQKCGRVIRTTTGEQHGLWLDHAGNCLRLGMPVDIDRAELCTAKPGDKINSEAEAARIASKCPKCKAVKTAKICVCGYESRRETDISEGAGQLARIDGGKAGPKKDSITDEAKFRFHAELTGYATEKGKKPGYAAAVYKQRFKEWPKQRYVAPIKPTPETMSYIRASQIRYAKGMGKYQGKA